MNRKRFNILDTPDYRPFRCGDAACAPGGGFRIVILDSVAGVESKLRRPGSSATSFGQPRLIVINKMDRDNASFERSMQSVEEAFGRTAVQSRSRSAPSAASAAW